MNQELFTIRIAQKFVCGLNIRCYLIPYLYNLEETHNRRIQSKNTGNDKLHPYDAILDRIICSNVSIGSGYLYV